MSIFPTDTTAILEMLGPDLCPIKAGDRLFISNGVIDIEGEAMWSISHPYDEIIAIREDDGTELKVNGWQADVIIVNDVEYEG